MLSVLGFEYKKLAKNCSRGKNEPESDNCDAESCFYPGWK